jgi:hypothetical protein
VQNADSTRSKFTLHGPAIEIACDVPAIAGQICSLFEPFAVSGWPRGLVPTTGIVRPYIQSEVLRYLSPKARPVASTSDLVEIFQDGERFWLVDDRWGMVEVNMLRGQFRSWILENPRLDPVRCAEMAILWPLAQLLRAKGLYLVPSVSVVRDGWAAMILCPFTFEAEIISLIRAGYKVIGQRWTAVREEDGRLALLHVPGAIERSFIPRLRSSNSPPAESAWVDLSSEYIGSWQNHAFCDAILVAGSGRRDKAYIRDIDPSQSLDMLRRAWPIAELHPNGRQGQLPLKLAQHTRVCELQLSRSPRDLLDLLATLRSTPIGNMFSECETDLAITPWAGLRPVAGVAA